MKKIFFLLCIAGSINCFAQTKTLVGVLTATPKMGEKSAFETAWKAHLKKFHQADTTDRRGVYEVMSGVRTGSYYLTDGDMSWADFDVERTNDKAHDMDYESTIIPTIATESGENIFRWADTLSYNSINVKTDKFLLTFYHIKAGKQNDVTDEIKRSIAVDKKINSPVSFDGFIQQLSGSQPGVIILRNLKNGFKEIDPDFFKGLNDQFKAAYLEMYGQPAWDKRMNALADLTELTEQEMLKYRADLSSAK